VNGVLRGQPGYQGVVVTDGLGAQSVIVCMRGQGYSDPTQGIAEASVRAFLAGDDLLLCPLSQTVLQAVRTKMTQVVQSGRISSAQLHAAVHRILRLTVALSLISLPYVLWVVCPERACGVQGLQCPLVGSGVRGAGTREPGASVPPRHALRGLPPAAGGPIRARGCCTGHTAPSAPPARPPR
jgi:hypothetical protein